MEFIIKLEKDDINTGKIGNNYQIVTQKGLVIIFDKEAIIELITDYLSDKKEVSDAGKEIKTQAATDLTKQMP